MMRERVEVFAAALRRDLGEVRNASRDHGAGTGKPGDGKASARCKSGTIQ